MSNIPALVLIDNQRGFEDEEYWGGNRNNPDSDQVIAKVLNHWRTKGWPVFHVIHSSRIPESRLHQSHWGYEIVDILKPKEGEPLYVKEVNSAFIGTNLHQDLQDQQITKLVLVGMTTNHCVSTTARMAANMEYDTTVLSDGTASFDRIGTNGQKYDSELIHQISLANIHDEFVEVIDSEELLLRVSNL